MEIDQSWLRRILHQLEETRVEASVEIGSADVPLGTLLNLQVGDIICLDQDCDSQLVVKIEGVPKFTGYARKFKQKKALEISGRLTAPGNEEMDEYE